ncbi:MAG: hypothetical protein HQK53_16935 [Oligoflexia bacterium]|nr:hypothetical protein [Oligoflexia bacterium]
MKTVIKINNKTNNKKYVIQRVILLIGLLILFFFTGACATKFKAERVSTEKSDERALEITDKWVSMDTTNVIKDTLKQIKEHRGFKNYMGKRTSPPKLFIGEVQNRTAEAYYPIDDLNDELLNELSASGDYVLVDAAARSAILKEITYQNDGMVDPNTAKNIGKQTGADLMIFGSVFMKPETRDGKTIKQYSVNLRMTDIETAVEVVRTRAKLDKYSEQKGSGW